MIFIFFFISQKAILRTNSKRLRWNSKFPRFWLPLFSPKLPWPGNRPRGMENTIFIKRPKMTVSWIFNDFLWSHQSRRRAGTSGRERNCRSTLDRQRKLRSRMKRSEEKPKNVAARNCELLPAQFYVLIRIE